MDSEHEHLEHHQHDALSNEEPVPQHNKLHEDENLQLNELSARKDSQPRDHDNHNDTLKDSEYNFEHKSDEEDLLKDNDNQGNSEGDQPSSETDRKEENEDKNDESQQTEEKVDEDRNESEVEQSNQNEADEPEGEAASNNAQRDEESKEESANQESEDKAVEQPEYNSEDGESIDPRPSSFTQKKHEQESHKMEEEDVDHNVSANVEENHSEDQEEASHREEPMQIDEPEPEAQQTSQNESAPEKTEVVEEAPQQVAEERQPEVHEEKVEPEAPVAKKTRGRKAKKDKSVEPKLEKRQELSVPKETAKGNRKKSQESQQESVYSERGAYSKEHELKHLGKELYRSPTTVIYVSEGPIDAHYFSSCLIKHRLPRKYKGKEAENPSLNKLKQEVSSLAKAKTMGVPVPAVYAVNLKHRLICIEFFKNHITLQDYLESKSDDYDDDTIIEMRKLFTTLGNHISEMHNGNVIHGGLSISNVLVDKAKMTLKIISFGESSSSGNIEDKATDLYAFIRSFPDNSEEYMRYSDLTHCVYTGYTAKSLKLDSVVQRVQKIKQKLKSQAH